MAEKRLWLTTMRFHRVLHLGINGVRQLILANSARFQLVSFHTSTLRQPRISYCMRLRIIDGLTRRLATLQLLGCQPCQAVSEFVESNGEYFATATPGWMWTT